MAGVAFAGSTTVSTPNKYSGKGGRLDGTAEVTLVRTIVVPVREALACVSCLVEMQPFMQREAPSIIGSTRPPQKVFVHRCPKCGATHDANVGFPRMQFFPEGHPVFTQGENAPEQANPLQGSFTPDEPANTETTDDGKQENDA